MHRVLMISIASFFLSPAAAIAAWNPSGSPVCVAPGFQGDLIAVPVPLAYATSSWQSMFTLWSDARDTVPASADLYFDLIDPFGPADPPTNGSPAVAAPGFQGYADACFTGTVTNHLPRRAGVIVAWADDRNGALDVYARRLFDSPFNTPWPADGVPVCVATGAQSSIHVVGDAGAGAILAWLDPRTGFNSVYAQRLDLNGVAQWAANGIPVCDVPGYRYNLRLVAAPDGGAYFVWTDDHLGSFKTFATRLLPDGTRAPGWPADGLPVSSLVTSSLGPAVADGAGGLYVTFLSGSAQPIACRIDPNAAVHAGWPADGAVLAATPIGGGIDDAVEYQGGLVVVWRKDVDPQLKIFTYDLFAQRVLADGTRPAGWGNDGNLLCDAPNDQVNARLAAGAPVIVAVWEDSRGNSSAPDIYAMRLTDSGSPDPMWPPNGVLVAGGNGRQFSPRPVWDGLGGVMIAYVDDHDFNSLEADIYAQRVNLNGTLANVGVPEPRSARFDLAMPVPNPARTEVTVAFTAGEGESVSAAVLDALGRRVRALDAGRGEAAALRWDLTDDRGRRVAPGIYYVRVSTSRETAARAVIVRR